MVEEGCEMLGDLVLLLAFAVHARYVLRDVEGLLPAEEKRKKSQEGQVCRNPGRAGDCRDGGHSGDSQDRGFR